MKAVIIGCGAISHIHAQAMAMTGIELLGVYNRTEVRGREFAAQHGTEFYADPDAMIRNLRPDIVVNALTPRYHHLGIAAAAELGCRIVIEKPFACSVEDAAQIRKLAGNASVFVSESSAYDPNYHYIRDNPEKFGTPRFIFESNLRHYFDAMRNSWCKNPHDGLGGMLLNLGVHRVCGMRLLAGADELSVSAVTGKIDGIAPVEGDCGVLIRYANGCCGVLNMCGYFGGLSSGGYLYTDLGYIGLRPEFKFIRDDRKEILPYTLFDGGLAGYAMFYREVIDGKAYSIESGIRDMAVILAALESSKQQREILIDEILQ